MELFHNCVKTRTKELNYQKKTSVSEHCPQCPVYKPVGDQRATQNDSTLRDALNSFLLR